MADIEIEIDGKKLTAKPNQTVIQVADDAGIYIPRFCYHKHLSIPANCRMCLVEVEKSPKVVPACSTPVASGMKVFTKSAKTVAAQRAVMEFLLINHPLDCPICDQGGECELQDLSMGYGSSWSHYDESKRAVADQNLGPLIETEMTRCIYCTRCVRFGNEVAGLPELGLVGRGEFTEVGTYIEHYMQSEVSGNIIDLCPVGALTSKPFRFTARAWELDQSTSISPHDCVGSNLNIHTRYGKVMRAVAHENNAVNGTWISDRDRFSYTGLYHADRLEEPRIRIDGEWQVVEWQSALEAVRAGLQETIALHGADKLGALVSPNATLEECYLLQKLMRGLGSPHIDHRLRAQDTSDETHLGAFPGLPFRFADLKECDAICLIGSNLQKEQPIAALNVRQATLKGARVMAINPLDYRFSFKVNAKQIVAPHLLVETLYALLQTLQQNTADEATALHFRDKKNSVILLGALAMHHPQAALIRALANQIGDITGAKIGYLTDGANSAGAYLAGCVPFRHADGSAVPERGLNAYAMLEKPRNAYILLNIDPELDFANTKHALDSLKHADFVVAISLYRNTVLEQHADVILPMAAFTETSGTYVNAASDWQSFTGSAQPFSASRPAWKILRVLGNFLHLAGFDYESSEEIRHEVKKLVEQATYPSKKLVAETHVKSRISLSRIGEIPIYATDSLVRRAKPLQEAQAVIEGDLACARIHPKTAERLKLAQDRLVNLTQGQSEMQLSLVIDEKIAENAIFVAGGLSATSHLGDLFGEIHIETV